MSDPSFDTEGRARPGGRIHEAVRRAANVVGFDQATKNLASRCVEFIRECELTDSESTIPSAFLVHLGATSDVFPDVAVHVRVELRNGLDACLHGGEHELRDVSALLLGRATSAALMEALAADPPADALVPQLFQLCGEDSLAYDALIETLAGALREDKSARRAMLAYLGEGVDDINEHPGKFVYEKDRESFDRYVREWREDPLIVDLWRRLAGQRFLASFDRLDAADAVLRAAPAETLGVLDRLRFPPPLDWILHNDSIREDREKIMELVEVAPGCVDGDGVWNGSILALLLLGEADGHCRDLWRTMHQNDTDVGEVQELLRSWLTQLAAVVVGRGDGMFLASRWLMMKSIDERFERESWGDGAFLPQLRMIGWIGGGLVEAGLKGADITSVPHPNVENNDEDGSEGVYEAANLDTLALEALLDRLHDDTMPDGRELLRRLDVLLGKRDLGFEVEATFDVGVTGFVDSSIGYLLAMTDCADRWKQSWDLLAEQRRVVQHWRHTKDSNALAPSLFLVRAGLAALDWLCSESFDRREVAETLWRTMFDAVRECWLTITVTHLAQSVERDIGRLFGRHSTIFGASTAAPDSNLPYSQRLADDLGRLGGDDALMARCCELVSRNLQDEAHLHDALLCNSGQGRAVLERFLQWQQLERRARKGPELRQAVEKILTEMK